MVRSEELRPAGKADQYKGYVFSELSSSVTILVKTVLGTIVSEVHARMVTTVGSSDERLSEIPLESNGDQTLDTTADSRNPPCSRGAIEVLVVLIGGR